MAVVELLLQGEPFRVSRSLLVSNCQIFLEDSSLLSRPYHVQANVSRDNFQVFIAAIGGKNVDINYGNVWDIDLLCKEFNFETLATKVEEWLSLQSSTEGDWHQGDSSQGEVFPETEMPTTSRRPQEDNRSFQDETRNVQDRSGSSQDETRNAQDESRNPPARTRNVQDRTRSFQDEVRNPPDRTRNFQDETQNPPDRTRSFQDETRNPPDKTRNLQDRTRNPPDKTRNLQDETRNLQDRTQSFQDETRNPSDRTRNVQDRTRNFQDETRNPPDRTRSFQDGTRNVQDRTRSFQGETRNPPDRTRNFQDETRNPPDRTRSFQDETRNPPDRTRSFQDETRNPPDKTRSFQDETRSFEDENRSFEDETRNLQDVTRSLQDETRNLCNEIRNLRDEVRDLQNEVRKLREENRQIQEENRRGQGKITWLEDQIKELKRIQSKVISTGPPPSEIRRQEQQSEAQQREIEELRSKKKDKLESSRSGASPIPSDVPQSKYSGNLQEAIPASNAWTPRPVSSEVGQNPRGLGVRSSLRLGESPILSSELRTTGPTVNRGERPVMSNRPAPASMANQTIPLKHAKRFAPSDPLKGIIAFLTRECGGNVNDRGVVTVTSSKPSAEGSFHAAKNIVDLKADSAFYSVCHGGDIPHTGNNWVCYDFKTRKVTPTHYTIRSFWNSEPDGPNPRSWLVESSLNALDWTEIDKKEDCQDLNGKNITRTFPVSRSIECRYIRLVNVGRNWNGDDRLWISAWEIFGTLNG